MKNNLSFLGSMILVIVIVMVTSYGLFAQSKGGRWQFENNGDDTADWDQVNNNGSLSGNAFYGNVPPLIEGTYYLSIEDTNQYSFFYVPDNYELDFSNEDVAISAWIYPVTVNEPTQFFVIKGDHEANPKTNNYALRLQGDHLNFIIRDNNDQAHYVSSTFVIPVNQWTFVAAFYDYSESLVYLWNQPVTEATDTLLFNYSLFPNTNRLNIGAWGQEGYRRFYGRIDDVRISGRLEDVIPNSTKIENNPLSIAESFQLQQNYPNPFNATTFISFSLPIPQVVSLTVYDNQGRVIETLINNHVPAGRHKVLFDAGELASGFYFCQLKSENYLETKKMLLLK